MLLSAPGQKQKNLVVRIVYGTAELDQYADMPIKSDSLNSFMEPFVFMLIGAY